MSASQGEITPTAFSDVAVSRNRAIHRGTCGLTFFHAYDASAPFDVFKREVVAARSDLGEVITVAAPHRLGVNRVALRVDEQQGAPKRWGMAVLG